MMDPSSLRTTVKQYLHRLAPSTAAIDDTSDLFAAGVLKSMHVLELVNYLEDSFGVAVSQRDLFGGRLRTVASIGELVAERALRKAS